MTDGNLRKLFQARLPHAHWVPIETWSTGQGVPDVNFCFPDGVEGWIENKISHGYAVKISPHQIAWLERRSRVGGRTFVAVRRQAASGPRRGDAADELHLYCGADVRVLSLHGLESEVAPLGRWVGGPTRWGWPAIEELLKCH